MNGQYYYSDPESASPFFSPQEPADPWLTPSRILWHSLLLFFTFITTTISGAIFPFLLQDTDLMVVYKILTTTKAPIINGFLFSFTLLFILGMHELGHYIACRHYRIQATLPYFIPVPPPLGIGTLGAFIRIKSAIRNKRELFDVGISGPLAGFIFAIPAAIVGIYYGQPANNLSPTLPITFHHPLLFSLIAKILRVPANTAWNPIWFACWIGMLATALNLLPVGQLDGGHIIYSLFGKRGHRLIATTIATIQLAIAYFAYKNYNWGGGFIYGVMLIVLLFLRHPQIIDEEEPLGWERKLCGVIALIVFILSYMPIPLKISQ